MKQGVALDRAGTFGERQPAAAASHRTLVAGSVGNFIEWYEFAIYGFFATVIAANFFSASGGSDLESLIKTYASFALAFFFRPLGAALFGYLGDRYGRRLTLIAVLLLMSGATTLIGLLPAYATLGVWAPILITLVRCLQGLSAGGEFGDAVSVMTEFAPPGRRGLYGAWQSFTVALGLLVGAAAAAVATHGRPRRSRLLRDRHLPGQHGSAADLARRRAQASTPRLSPSVPPSPVRKRQLP